MPDKKPDEQPEAAYEVTHEVHMAADKKPADKPVEKPAPVAPKFHPEAPYPAPPMSDKPWSDEVEDDKKPAKKADKS